LAQLGLLKMAYLPALNLLSFLRVRGRLKAATMRNMEIATPSGEPPLSRARTSLTGDQLSRAEKLGASGQGPKTLKQARWVNARLFVGFHCGSSPKHVTNTRIGHPK
jgi:hypothetical protein